MSQLRTISRASNWTPDRLRVLSAVVVSADHVGDEPLGRVEGVVLDERDEIQSFIVTLWEKGVATRAVLVPLAWVRWYTEGFAPALGIAWAPEILRGQPALERGGGPRRPSIGVVALAKAVVAPVEAVRPGRSMAALAIGLIAAAACATLGSLLLDPMLAGSLALMLAPTAFAFGDGRRPDIAAVAAPALPVREPWLAHLEKNLVSPESFERRVLHFSLLHEVEPTRRISVSIPVGAMVHALPTGKNPHLPATNQRTRATGTGSC